jgi:putative toxin-antitoxin system antitoxin component (TIGR02293 family)
MIYIKFSFGNHGRVVMEVYKPATKREASREQGLVRKELGNLFYYNIGMLSPQKTNIVLETRNGFSVVVVDKMSKHLGIPQKDFLPIIGLSAATFSRRRKEEGRLKADESDNVYRVASVFKEVLGLFEGDEAAARSWIRSPAKALGNITPLSLLDSQAGADQVRDLIGRLDSGVYT